MSKYEKLWWLEKATRADERDINKLRLPNVLLQHHDNSKICYVLLPVLCSGTETAACRHTKLQCKSRSPHAELAIYFPTKLAAYSLFRDFESCSALLGNRCRSKILADL
jgi:hypothetical protein